MGLLDFDVGAWGACFVLPMPWSTRRLGSGRLHRLEQSCATPAPLDRLRFSRCDGGCIFRRHCRARHRVDAHHRKQCAAERLEAYAAFRLAMTCLKSVTNST
jgi:hypothetical protein